MGSPTSKLSPIGLAGEKVQIWTVRLIASGPVLDAYGALLCAEERDRAGRFQFEHVRRAYTMSRGALRALLGCYTGCRPQDVVFAYGEKGKPSLAGLSRLRFKASHSAGLALYGFALDRDLGVDVEHFRTMNNWEDVARRFFSAREISDLESLSPDERTAGFFRY